MNFFNRFKNPPGGPKLNYNLFKWLGFFIRRLLDRPPSLPNNHVISRKDALLSYHKFKNENTLTWLGHATFLIKLNGITILTDPFMTNYASPIAGLGPKRFAPPGFKISDLPKINIIAISHDHFDHLDLRTLAKLPNKSDIHVIVPLHLGHYFKRLGYKLIHELKWYELWNFNTVNIRALPAYHFSKRNLFTRNTRLWASYAIEWEGKKIYFNLRFGFQIKNYSIQAV